MEDGVSLWEKQSCPGVMQNKTFSLCRSKKCAAFTNPAIIIQELICIYSNLAHSVTRQLPPGVWQEQARTVTSFLYLAVSDKADVLSRITKVFLWGWECLNDKSFYRLPHGRS